jgi:hypothetical protein
VQKSQKNCTISWLGVFSLPVRLVKSDESLDSQNGWVNPTTWANARPMNGAHCPLFQAAAKTWRATVAA